MKKVLAFVLVVVMLLGVSVSANNPIVKEDDQGNRVYAGDPAAIVVDDTVYLFCGHDTSTTNYYYMPEWLCYSSKDLVNWTYEGVPMKASDFSWARLLTHGQVRLNIITVSTTFLCAKTRRVFL